MVTIDKIQPTSKPMIGEQKQRRTGTFSDDGKQGTAMKKRHQKAEDSYSKREKDKVDEQLSAQLAAANDSEHSLPY